MTLNKMQVYTGALDTVPSAANMTMVRIIPPQTRKQDIPRMKGCYSFSIDNSGSMGCAATVVNDDGDKVNHGWSQLDIAKHATNSFVSSLGDEDWVAITCYSDSTVEKIGWTRCNEVGKTLITSAIMDLRPESSTNMVAGINGGLEKFKYLPSEIELEEYNLTMILTTDGLPSNFYHPARGISGYKPLVETQLKQHRQAGRFVNLITIGLGENLDSMLLTDISGGSGEFLHLPDPGSVGPFMVNLVAQCRSIARLPNSCRPTNNMYLRLSPANNVACVPGYERIVELRDGDLFVPLKNILVDSPRHIVFQKNSNDTQVNCTLCYKNKEDHFEQISAQDEELSDLSLVSLHTLRQLAVQAMLFNFNCDTYNENLQTPINEVLTLINNIKTNLPYNEKWENMFMTISNEVLPGISSSNNFARWGRHYIRTLALNLRREIRTNFRDTIMQDFVFDKEGQSARFEEESQRAESIFANTRAPEPSLLLNRLPTSSVPRATVLPEEFMRGGGCFAQDCTVDRWNGDKFETLTLDEVRPHDELRTLNGKAEVKCVVKTLCPENKAELVTFTLRPFAPLVITPWHPILVNRQWFHPTTIVAASSTAVQNCPFVYNFVLHTEHILQVSGVSCVTLGHGFKEPVVEHEYWGNTVIKDLEKKNGWNKGYVVLTTPLAAPPVTNYFLRSGKFNKSSRRMVIQNR